ncbi:MAG TPA: SGNH/GDSL hydrolase family protein [Candidatus Limnocylindria bacterium]|nr:SGNH/GDSL hydrolase family protein [Candidatus Limnocylindria bacterium]
MAIPERFLALGDSFTIGTGTTPDRSFPAVLAAIWRDHGAKVETSNPSVNGYTSDDLIAEELPLVAAFDPDLVTILIGANDIVQGSGEDRYRAQVARIHKRIRADALDARVIGLPQPDWSLAPAAAGFGDTAVIRRTIERFNEIAREEAERAGGMWVDLFPLMREQARKRMFASDGLHPSAEAYAEWARELSRASVWSP